MKKIYNTAEEMVDYFMNHNTDTREWGILRDFSITKEWRGWFWDAKNKYVRGRSFNYCNKFAEWHEATKNCQMAFIRHIENKGINFPCEVEIVCLNYDGYGADFNTTFTAIPEQLTFL